MSFKKIEQVKNDKWFSLFDLIIYGSIIILVAVLFIVIFTTRDTNPLSGVRIYASAQAVYEYEFGKTQKGEDGILSDGVEVEEDGDGITVTIRSADGDYNVVYIDKSKKSVKMIKANCRGGQCLDFPSMNDNSKFIYCSPHGIKIEPYTKDLDDPNIIL